MVSVARPIHGLGATAKQHHTHGRYRRDHQRYRPHQQSVQPERLRGASGTVSPRTRGPSLTAYTIYRSAGGQRFPCLFGHVERAATAIRISLFDFARERLCGAGGRLASLIGMEKPFPSQLAKVKSALEHRLENVSREAGSLEASQVAVPTQRGHHEQRHLVQLTALR